ncbi:unnamed protein product [Lampetra fluviatilis]
MKLFGVIFGTLECEAAMGRRCKAASGVTDATARVRRRASHPFALPPSRRPSLCVLLADLALSQVECEHSTVCTVMLVGSRMERRGVQVVGDEEVGIGASAPVPTARSGHVPYEGMMGDTSDGTAAQGENTHESTAAVETERRGAVCKGALQGRQGPGFCPTSSGRRERRRPRRVQLSPTLLAELNSDSPDAAGRARGKRRREPGGARVCCELARRARALARQSDAEDRGLREEDGVPLAPAIVPAVASKSGGRSGLGEVALSPFAGAAFVLSRGPVARRYIAPLAVWRRCSPELAEGPPGAAEGST